MPKGLDQKLHAYRVGCEGCRLVVKALLDAQLPLQTQHHQASLTQQDDVCCFIICMNMTD